MEYKVLNNGMKMPMVGLGVYNISDGEPQRVVENAVSVGYRSIDTAAMYYNEKGVGGAECELEYVTIVRNREWIDG